DRRPEVSPATPGRADRDPQCRVPAQIQAAKKQVRVSSRRSEDAPRPIPLKRTSPVVRTGPANRSGTGARTGRNLAARPVASAQGRGYLEPVTPETRGRLGRWPLTASTPPPPPALAPPGPAPFFPRRAG